MIDRNSGPAAPQKLQITQDETACTERPATMGHRATTAQTERTSTVAKLAAFACGAAALGLLAASLFAASAARAELRVNPSSSMLPHR
jgi:hypothetical protein